MTQVFQGTQQGSAGGMVMRNLLCYLVGHKPGATVRLKSGKIVALCRRCQAIVKLEIE